MKLTTRMAAVFGLALVLTESNPAAAAWNNVFQTCCHTCRPPSTSSSFFAPAPSSCCPSVSYVQRSYYQPVTSYKTQTYYEPVTTYKRSYHWEGVTRYRYTSYYDPCTGCSQSVATPYTSYYLRSQCNPVQSYVQRCRTVPVTEYRQSYYLEPVVSYSGGCDAPMTAPATIPPSNTPGLSETQGAPGLRESGEPPRIPKTDIPGSFTRPAFPGTAPVAKPFRMDRTTNYSDVGSLQGMLVRDDRITPRANTQLLFVSNEKKGVETVTSSDATGRFSVELPAGEWTLFVKGQDGKPTYHSLLTMRQMDQRLVTLVSR